MTAATQGDALRLNKLTGNNFSTYFGYLVSFLAALAPVISQIADVARPLNIPDSTWLKISAIVAIATSAGKGLQAVFGSSKVTWGWASIPVIIAFLLSTAATVLNEVSKEFLVLGVSPALMAQISAALAIALVLIRMGQAALAGQATKFNSGQDV
jgi:hypothetical protein